MYKGSPWENLISSEEADSIWIEKIGLFIPLDKETSSEEFMLTSPLKREPTIEVPKPFVPEDQLEGPFSIFSDKNETVKHERLVQIKFDAPRWLVLPTFGIYDMTLIALNKGRFNHE